MNFPSFQILTDVQFVTVVRPPDKRYQEKQQRIKDEIHNIGADDDNIIQSSNSKLETNQESVVCKRCQLIKDADKMQPPNMSKEEMNYLLLFTYTRIRSWLPDNTYSPLGIATRKVPFISKAQFEIFKKIFLRFPVLMFDIKQKIDRMEYETLNEFQADLLDIQHSIGVLHGVASQEYEATNYLKKDSTFEINEIWQCRDCYRHSNELSDSFWFTKPCVIRHELVFAKQIGFPYWPAKVIKVVDRKYDVRFFGGKHARAIIDANFVKPIDTSLDDLKITKKSPGLLKALEELEIHRQKVALPVGTFSYENEKELKIQNQQLVQVNDVSSVVPQITKRNGKKRGRGGGGNIGGTKRASKRKKPNTESSVESTSQTKSPTSSILSSSTLFIPSPVSTSDQNAPILSSPVSIVPDNPPMLLQSDTFKGPRIKGQLKEQRNANVVDALKKQLDQMTNPLEIKQLAIHTLETEVAWWQRRVKKLTEDNQIQMSYVKRKQWVSISLFFIFFWHNLFLLDFVNF